MENDTSKILKPGYKAEAFIITAQTNIHAGSGKNDYAIIDNLVQRDILTNYPCIQASSIKGAFREYFSYHSASNATEINSIFGGDTNTINQAGSFIFMQANLLTIPIRSDIRPFFRATSPSIIKDYVSSMNFFGQSNYYKKELNDLLITFDLTSDKILFDDIAGLEVTFEDEKIKAKGQKINPQLKSELDNLFGEYWVVLHDDMFNKLVSDEYLPIIARNHLENGISQNLWYEQILPRQTRFYTQVLYPNGSRKLFDFFKNNITAWPVQIGANASIGYGFCDIKPIAL